jgi:ParB family chromosome partitioning protein
VPKGDDGKLLELALIENIQRENLNPVEEAGAYRRLLHEFHLTQEQVAAAVGKDRATVANYLRLLKLPEDVRRAVAAGDLSMGHARALLGLDDGAAGRAARDVISRGLSVRAPALVARLAKGKPSRRFRRAADVHEGRRGTVGRARHADAYPARPEGARCHRVREQDGGGSRN